MADFVFNTMKGKWGYYVGLPAAADGLILIPLLSSGLETDATLRDYDTVSDLLAGSTNENTTVGRKTITTGITPTVNDTTDVFSVTIGDQTYTAPGASGEVGAFVVAYDPDTGAGTDTTLVPGTKHDRTWTPDGNDTVITFTTTQYSAT